MSLKEIINEDMKSYMRDKNATNLGAVRMLKSDIKNAEIEAMKELSDDEIIKVIQSSIKKRKDAADIFTKSARQDLADKELAEITALEKYLPAQLSEDEICKIAKEIIAGLEEDKKKNFGAVMKAVSAKTGSSAEGRTVSKVIKDIMDGNR